MPSDFATLNPPSSCNAQQESLVITSNTWCINIVPEGTYSALTPPTLGTADPAASAAPPTQLGANITHYQGGVLSYSCVMNQDLPVGSYELSPPTNASIHPSLSPVTPFVLEESHSMSCTSEGERYPSEMDCADIKPFMESDMTHRTNCKCFDNVCVVTVSIIVCGLIYNHDSIPLSHLWSFKLTHKLQSSDCMKKSIGHVSQEHVPIPIEVSPEGQYVPSDFVTLNPPSSCNAQQGNLVITSNTVILGA